MTIKIKHRILALTICVLLVLPVYAASGAAGFSRIAPEKLFTPALAQSNDPPAPEPIILNDEQGEYPLGLHLEILEDPGGELTIEEVSSSEFDSRFLPSQEPVPNIGLTDSAIWVRFRLENQTPDTDEWLLEQGFANTHYIDLYSPLPGGVGFAVKQSGVLRPVTTRDVLYPKIIFKLTVPPQSQGTYYLRFQSGASMTLPLTLWTQDAFLDRALAEQILMGIFYGVLIGLLFYNLFLFFSLREFNYLFYVILLASLIFEEASYSGYLLIYGFPGQIVPTQYIEPVAFPLLIGSMVLFSDSFLELRTRLPKLHTVSLVILAVGGLLVLIVPFTSYHVIAILMWRWALISLLTVLWAGIVSWRRGFRPARFFIVAWLGLVLSVVWVMLVRVGLSSSSLLSENAFRLGYLWVAVCWSIALADRINLLKAETEDANRDLRNSKHRLSEILEGIPLGVLLYGNDHKPKYINQRAIEILSNSNQGIQPDISAGRSLEQALNYFSLKVAGKSQIYPIENFPVYSALHREPAMADYIEVDKGDKRVPLEIWASPVLDDAGHVESAVVAFQDVTLRKQAEAEVLEYRKHLEKLVESRTGELNSVNEQLWQRIEWLSAINQVNQIMAGSADFMQIYAKIIEIINTLFSSQDSFIAQSDAGYKQWKILAHSCNSDLHPVLTGSLTSLPETILSDPDPTHGNPKIYSKDQLSSSSGPLGMHIQVTPIHSILLVPIISRDSVSGFLGLEIHDKDRIITPDEYNLLNIFALDVAQLFEDERLYQQSRALITAEERNRLARDLHDSVTQMLFSITLLAEVLPQIFRREPEQGFQRLEKLRRLTRGALAEMRTMLIELRPTALINTPLGDLLAQLTEAVASRSGLPFELFIEQTPSLPENVQTNFYRIAQEALNNVVKHAQARKVTVSLSDTPLPHDLEGVAGYEVRLVIQDDGVGYSTGVLRSDHMGFSIMRERAAAIQASLSLESQPGHGTQVTIIWDNETGSRT